MIVLAATPSPTPVEMEAWVVSPGLEGFFWGFFLLAAAAIPLFWSMTRHMRRVDRNARLRDEAEAATAAQDAARGATAAEGAAPGTAAPAATVPDDRAATVPEGHAATVTDDRAATDDAAAGR